MSTEEIKRTPSDSSISSKSSNSSSGNSGSSSSDDDLKKAGKSKSTRKAIVIPREILIVEDFRMTQEFLSSTLTYCRSATCTVCKDGAEALAMLESHGPFDLIMTDIMMSGLNGIEFIRSVRAMEAQHAWTPQSILAMSADQVNRERALAAGATQFIGKYDAPLTVAFAILDALNGQ